VSIRGAVPEEDIMTSSLCEEDVMTSSGYYPDGASLCYDPHKSQSSSEELLSSTPGSSSAALPPAHCSSAEELFLSSPGSRSASLDRILENQRLMAAAGEGYGFEKRSRSSSRGDRSSPMMKYGEEKKTPDTDTSESSLPPPPPPPLLEHSPHSPAVLKPLPKPRASPPEPCELPLGHLRDSLRKTKHPTSKSLDEVEDSGVGVPGETAKVTSLDSLNNAKQVINRYSTIPKGTRIGAFLASLQQSESGAASGGIGGTSIKESLLDLQVKSPELEHRLHDKSRLMDDRDTVSLSNYPQMPTPEVKRKVEEWRAGVERSMTEPEKPEKPKIPHEKPKYTKPVIKNEGNPGLEHNVKPSSLRSSSSTHAVPATSAAEKNFLTRQKSDLTGLKSDSTEGAGDAKPEWKRRVTTKPVARMLPQYISSAAEDTAAGYGSSGYGSSPPRNPLPQDDNFMQKRSPPVLKKIQPQLPPQPPPPDTSPSDSKPEESDATHSLTNTKQKPGRSSFSEKIGFLRSSKKDSDKKKKGFFNKDKDREKEDASKSNVVYAKPMAKDPTKTEPSPDEEKSVPHGGRLVLPGGAGAGLISSPKQLHRMSLHHVDIEKEKPDTDPDEPVSKETVLSVSRSLKTSLDTLNSRTSKHTSNFMHLSEEVQAFYDTCSRYVEGLPPHGKFHFRELLTTLQNIAECLKMCSGSNAKDYDKLLTQLHNSINDINNGINKR
jgi:hypothetical protein